MIPPTKVTFPPQVFPRVMDDIQSILRTGYLTLGPHGQAMERKMLQVLQLHESAWQAVATSSGTSALEILLRTMLPTVGEIIMPSNTFAATAFAVRAAGHTPVLCDMESEGLGLDPDEVEKLITERTVAIVTVHIGGIVSPKIFALRAVADEHKIPLLEDAAHAHGSTKALGMIKQVAGTFGSGASFSFYPTKVITSGEGGMVLLPNEHRADRARGMRDQGKERFDSNYHTQIGYNWRMSELHAVLGVHHLSLLAMIIADRQRTYGWYQEALQDVEPIQLQPIPDGCESNHYKIIGIIEDGSIERDELKKRLGQHQVRLAGEVYETPLHKQPVFSQEKKGPMRVTECFCDNHICFPLWYGMRQEEVEEVCEAIKKALEV